MWKSGSDILAGVHYRSNVERWFLLKLGKAGVLHGKQSFCCSQGYTCVDESRCIRQLETGPR